MSTPTDTANTAVSEAETHPEPPTTAAILRALVSRELSTAVLRRSTLLLWVGFLGVLLGIAWFGGGMQVGYTATVIDLLTPLELLVPVIAMALGYRAILSDERRGELDVLKTYPVASWQVVAGVYVGRAVGLVALVGSSLLVLLYPIFLTDAHQSLFYATHTGADSVWLYLRFVVLTVGFALVLLAVAIAISSLVGSTRSAVTAAGLGLFVLLFGADLALVYGLSRGFVDPSSLASSLAISPLSAYRSLVIETTVTVTAGTGPQTASPVAAAVGLLAWGVGSLAVAAAAIRR